MKRWTMRKSLAGKTSYVCGDLEITKMFVGLWKGHEGTHKQIGWAILKQGKMLPTSFPTLKRAKKYAEQI